MSGPGRLLITLMVILLLLPVLAACGKDGEIEEPGDSGEVAQQPPAVDQEADASLIPSVGPAASVAAATPTAGPPPAPLAAKVNGQYIFLEDYERRVALYAQALQRQGLELDSKEGQAELAQVRIDVLESLIDSVLMWEGGGELGLTVTEEEREAQLELDVKDGGGQAAFLEFIRICLWITSL